MKEIITFKVKFYYALGAFGKDIICAPIYILLFYYFTDILGFSILLVSCLFFISRVIDGILDPIMGVIIDNNYSRFGKFRHWIVVGSFFNAILFIGIFNSHKFDGVILYAYSSLMYILWCVTYTIVDIPFWSMITVLSKFRSNREILSVWARLFACAAWLVTSTYGLSIINKLNDDNGHNQFSCVVILMAIFFVLSEISFVANVKETLLKNDIKKNKYKLKLSDFLFILDSNDQLKVLIKFVSLFQISNLFLSSFAVYYFTYAFNNSDLFTKYMLAGGLFEILGIFLFPKLTSFFSRKFLWLLACGLLIFSCHLLIITFYLFPDNTLLIIFSGAIFKFGVGIANILQTVMFADVTDYGEYKTGFLTSSIIFSIQTMIVKFSGAISSLMIGAGLLFIGYIPNVEQSEVTIFGFHLLMIGIPVFLMGLSGYIYKSYYYLHEGSIH